MIEISSSSNPHFQIWKSLLSSKGLKKEGLFILSGEKLIHEFLQNPHLEIHAEILNKKLRPVTNGAKKYILAQELFDELDEVGTHFNLLILSQPEVKKADLTQKSKGLHVIAPLGDPSNLGALIRSAEAFDVAQFILTEEAAHPFLPKCVKASAGSVLRIPLLKGPKLSQIQHPTLIGLDLNGENLTEFHWPKDCYLIVGEEGPGLGQIQLYKKIKIPISGVESLNAVIATSIALYSYRSQQTLKNQI
ncbi:MAG: hypothetical protein BroJett040_10940 [Oligoflexia bacterium]|nr:MAG: hypothetical protein BroJett040_10940 [Oligoflexia bacterium]